ncbi:MAG: pyroglutamyl-peptidase I [Micrococcus sp.]|nr:pyroglutamyl-peptidase I [Micrococcus sp.]
MTTASAARILLTGFEPFGGDATNPSITAARAAAHQLRERGVAAEAVQLPCVFEQTQAVLRETIDRLAPEVVIAVGLAGGTARIEVERVAINLQDARIPDNAGGQPVDVPVRAGGPAALFATLPVKRCVDAVAGLGIPAALSLTAGSFVCNHVMYQLLDEPGTARAAGFVHVPWDTENAPEGSAHLSLNDLSAALVAIAEAAADSAPDVVRPGGALH